MNQMRRPVVNSLLGRLERWVALAEGRDHGDAQRQRALDAQREVAIASLRIGMGLMTIAAASDWLFATIAGAGFVAMLEGAALVALGAAGLVWSRGMARLLTPRGRVLILALLFAAVGGLDFGLQRHYPEVAPAIVWIAAIVASAAWVWICVGVSMAGYLADLALQGHSVAWMFAGAGQNDVANQLIDLAANAAVVLLLVAILRRFVSAIPASLASVRAGGRSLTPQLAIAAGRQARGLLPRADPKAVTASLTASERRVLALLIQGRAAKQAAYDLALSVATVRTHIASAKRKTGARTLEQLVALVAEAERER
jgi:DNA-binding CsgD family transcriptional regulator/small basic protein